MVLSNDRHGIVHACKTAREGLFAQAFLLHVDIKWQYGREAG